MASNETVRARVLSCALRGVEAVPVTVEIEVGSGLPGVHIVGLADASVQEARQRVRSAVRAAGFSMPARHMVVNLAPANLRKSGTAFDLAIAIAYLIATRQVHPEVVGDSIIVGELSLGGSVRATDGLFAYALAAHQMGKRLISGPVHMKMPELAGLEHVCINRLARLRTGEFLPPDEVDAPLAASRLDYKDVVGQDSAVRALCIAAAGGHGALLVGPPGAGKSMLARRLPTILPPLSMRERIETAVVHSVAGLDLTPIAAGERPFRSPHHSASVASLVGGGRPLRPGEASLAHNGVLFLDELGEFSNPALQALRQPIEDGQIVVARAQERAVFPARFQLIAASNPCPCGFLGDRENVCKCSEAQVDRYQGKLGGPLKDRIDLICEVSRVDPSRVLESGDGVSSSELRSKVLAARERAQVRDPENRALSAATPHEFIESCDLGSRQVKLVEEMARQHHLSGRGIIRVLRVARTIADLEESAVVRDEHLYESFMYRVENTLS